MTEKMFVCYEQGYEDADIKFVTPSKALATEWETESNRPGPARFVEEVEVVRSLPKITKKMGMQASIERFGKVRGRR